MMSERLYSWWLGQQAPLMVCLDCGKRGLTSNRFATALPGRISNKLFWGMGTCFDCYYGEV